MPLAPCSPRRHRRRCGGKVSKSRGGAPRKLPRLHYCNRGTIKARIKVLYISRLSHNISMPNLLLFSFWTYFLSGLTLLRLFVQDSPIDVNLLLQLSSSAEVLTTVVEVEQ